jgi:uncharacterized iron-regulated protein
MRYLIIIVLLLSPSVHAENSYSRILEGITPNSITIIGETHKRPEAIRFFQSLITGYTLQNKCLTVALEIASSQQSLFNAIMLGKATVTDIEIAPAIDHPPFRALINNLAEIQKQNNCLKLIAIDAGLELKTNRDEWMAIKLAEQVGQAPILALLGSLHTLKKVDWNPTMTKKEPYVAEILVARGFNVKSYPQHWVDRSCNTRNRLIPVDQPEAVELLNNDLFALLNASKPKAAINIIDGIVLWEC